MRQETKKNSIKSIHIDTKTEIGLDEPAKIAPISGVLNTLDSSEVRKVIKPVPFKPLKLSNLNNHNINNNHLNNHQLINTDQPLLSVVPINHNSTSTQRSITSRASRGTNGSIYSSPFSSLDSETEVNGLSNVSSKVISVSSSNLHRKDSIKSNLSNSHVSLSRSVSAVAVDEDHWYHGFIEPNPEFNFKLPPPVNWDASAIAASRRRPLMYSSEYLTSQTPSPNDSLIVELEALLREKDNEISVLRETLERNEQVIFKVYEEKGQSWEREFKKLKSQYETSLKSSQQRIARAEHAMSLQNKQNHAEKENLIRELEATRKRSDAVETANNCLRSELSDLKEMIETLKWTLHERNGEVALLKSQMRDSTSEINHRATEIVNLRKKCKECNETIDQLTAKNENLQKELHTSQDENTTQIHNLGQKIAENDAKLDETSQIVDQLTMDKRDLQGQLLSMQEQLLMKEKTFDEERMTWKDEKEKVLKYQQQLEINYRRLFNTNRILENLAILMQKENLSKMDEFQC